MIRAFCLNFIYFTTIMKQVIQHINYACWPQCLHSDGLRVGGNRSAGGNPPFCYLRFKWKLSIFKAKVLMTL